MHIDRNNPNYKKTLAKWLSTKEGTIFALYTISQLIDGFEVDYKGKIKQSWLDGSTGIDINLDDIERINIYEKV